MSSHFSRPLAHLYITFFHGWRSTCSCLGAPGPERIRTSGVRACFFRNRVTWARPFFGETPHRQNSYLRERGWQVGDDARKGTRGIAGDARRHRRKWGLRLWCALDVSCILSLVHPTSPGVTGGAAGLESPIPQHSPALDTARIFLDQTLFIKNAVIVGKETTVLQTTGPPLTATRAARGTMKS